MWPDDGLAPPLQWMVPFGRVVGVQSGRLFLRRGEIRGLEPAGVFDHLELDLLAF